jgi:hypothetical protein
MKRLQVNGTLVGNDMDTLHEERKHGIHGVFFLRWKTRRKREEVNPCYVNNVVSPHTGCRVWLYLSGHQLRARWGQRRAAVVSQA